jgi:hypothetical protein
MNLLTVAATPSKYSHEFANGYYGVLPFFLAKLLVDIILSRFLPNLIFGIITYFMIGELVALSYEPLHGVQPWSIWISE